MSKLYKISTEAKKVDEAIAAKHLVLPLSKIIGVVRNEDGEVLDEKQPLLKDGSYFVKFIKEEKSVNYTAASTTFTFKCDLKEKKLPHELKTHIRAVEETQFGEKNLGAVIDSDFIFADSDLEYYIDFTDKVVYAVDNQDVETEAEVLDDVNVLLEEPRTVAYHTEYPTEKDDWSEALGIEKPEEPKEEPKPEDPKPEDPKPEDPKKEDPKPEEPKKEEPKEEPKEDPKEEPKEDPKPEPKPEFKPELKKPEVKESSDDKSKSSKKHKVIGVVVAVVVLAVIVGLAIYHM
jgi:similarity|nr:MAG TPA: hypothetical protein [Caudoviricetes sp.]